MNEPVTLHYYFAPRMFAHRIKLTPIAIEDDAIVFSRVRLDGRPQ